MCLCYDIFMKRILAFCGRDWRDPKAGDPERYMHEVLRRIAAQGHYIVWVCPSYRTGLGWSRRPASLEVLDGIQVARLGARFLYRTMAGMFLSRLRERAQTAAPFDAILDCVIRRPLDLTDKTDTPIIPVVFGLSPRLRADTQPPGPVIAASHEAREALRRSGLPEKFIVTAPFGSEACMGDLKDTAGVWAADPSRPTAGMTGAIRRLFTYGRLRKKQAVDRGHTSTQTWDATAGLVLATIENLEAPVAKEPRRRQLMPVP